MSDESNIPANLEEDKELPVEVQPKEQQQLSAGACPSFIPAIAPSMKSCV